MNRIIAILEKDAKKQNIEFDRYIVENVSLYAADLNDDMVYHELVPEINSMLNFGNNSDIIKLPGKEGAL